MFSYSTCLAEFDNDVLYVNMTRYSVTSSAHRSALLHAAKLRCINVKYVSDVPIDTKHLL